MNLQQIQDALKSYQDVGGAKEFFSRLGYPTLPEPLPFGEADRLPEGARKLVDSIYLVSECKQPQLFEDTATSSTSSQFRIYHVELNSNALRRTDFRRILEAFYRRFPQGNNLFVFTLPLRPYRELAFVSPLKGFYQPETGQ